MMALEEVPAETRAPLPTSQMVRESLLTECLRRDPRAEEELYRALYPMMMSICSRYERNRQDAAARMNDGFLKVLLNLHRRRPEVPFDIWVRRIIINTVIDGYRKELKRKTHESMETPMDRTAVSEVNEYLRHMEAEAFAELLRRVPEASRKVFNLFAIDGYSHEEIAGMLSISIGTSKWHVSHARQLLQEAIARLAGSKVTVKNAMP
jgi:RNA polymerase sigma-70 factor (ECF subfamily)